MDAVAAEGQESDPMRWLVIGGVVAIALSTFALWAWLPEPLAVRWEWGGGPNNSMPKLGYVSLWSLAWALVASSLARVDTTVDLRSLLKTLVLGALIAGHVTTLENNLGAESWQQAEPLDVPVALLLLLIGSAMVWLTQRKWST